MYTYKTISNTYELSNTADIRQMTVQTLLMVLIVSLMSPSVDGGNIRINGHDLFQDQDGWILLLAYNHAAADTRDIDYGTAPLSPTTGYSHVWLDDLGMSSSEVESVRFYCTSGGHGRVMHFSANNSWIKEAIVTGAADGNDVSYWTSGTVKFSDHTAFLPDATTVYCLTRG